MRFLTQSDISGAVGQAIASDWIIEIAANGDRTGSIFWSGAAGVVPSKSATVADVAQIAAAGSVIPDWLPTITYKANDVVRATLAVVSAGIELGDIIRRRTAGTSGATLNATEAAAWDELGAQIVKSVAGKSGTVTLVSGDVGLANVNNTADTAKPVSAAQLTALNAKEPTITTLPLTKGGTGATTPLGARTALSLGDSSVRNVGSGANTVAAGDDARLSDARTPVTHAHAQSEVTSLVADLAAKQAVLVSGTNIRTVNGQGLVGVGDVAVAADLPGGTPTTVLDEGLNAGNAVIDRTTVPGETILRYTTTGAASTFVVPLGVTSVRAFVVGGGGGGGGGEGVTAGDGGGGGGAGEFLHNAAFVVTPSASLGVTVGGGGAGANSFGGTTGTNGTNGSDSLLGGLTAKGGGGGGGNDLAGTNGGSGGGGGGRCSTGIDLAGGTPTAIGLGIGFAGGAGTGVCTNRDGAGGGGAGGVGGDSSGSGTAGFAGAGGAAAINDITGSLVTYAGGGGGGIGSGQGVAGAGGSANGVTVGGPGGVSDGVGALAAVNTGSGGGGGGARSSGGLLSGGNGGSGVVIIRFPTQTRSFQTLQAFSSDATAATGGILIGQFYLDSTSSAVRQKVA